MKRFNVIEFGLSHKKVVFLVFAAAVVVGITGLVRMNRDEFPTFQIKQGLVAAVYPGATADEVREQVARPLEETLFSFPEVVRESTYSYSKNGICYIYVDINVPMAKKDEVWSKIKLKLNQQKAMLPAGVLGVAVVDNFAQVSSMLIALTSDDKGPTELNDYADRLSERLRRLDRLASVSVVGREQEEIAVHIDQERLALYGIKPSTLALGFRTGGFETTAGTFQTDEINAPLYVNTNLTTEGEIANRIVYSSPDGRTVRLADIGRVERRLEPATSYVEYNGRPALIISVEMRLNNNIVDFGRDVDQVLQEFSEELPPSVRMEKISDQPDVVNRSILDFIRDLVISILVVIAVMLLLFPFRSALIASSGVPVCVATAVACMYAAGIELNTVTLAALIITLGMIVDDSIITMDGYMDHLRPGIAPRGAAVASGTELFMPMFIATAAICCMFYPAIKVISNGYFSEFVRMFPYVTTFALSASLLYAVLIVPSLEVRFIHPRSSEPQNKMEKIQNRFFRWLQQGYDRAESFCFAHHRATLVTALGTVVLGVVIFMNLGVQMMPNAARNFFAIELYTEAGSTLKETHEAVDSLTRMLTADPRVRSVTSFVGTSAPRFNAIYPPLLPSENTAQLIVNTHSTFATAQLLKEYQDTRANILPHATIKYKQMNYQGTSSPLEVHVTGGTYDQMQPVADSIRCFMARMTDLTQCVRSTSDGFTPYVDINLDPDLMALYGINKTMLNLSLATATQGLPLTTIYEGSTPLQVRLYNDCINDSSTYADLARQPVPTTMGAAELPLGDVARLTPRLDRAQYYRTGGRDAIVVNADIKTGQSFPEAKKRLDRYIATLELPDGVTVENGGLATLNSTIMPEMGMAFVLAVLVLFLFLWIYFRKIRIAALTICLSALCLFGAFFGLWLFGFDVGVTSVLGLITLVGIIVRNGIIMFEYAEELQFKQGLDPRQAAMLAGQRRMRPIFLTSCTTALGVIPMILAGDILWMPMAVVICFGCMLSIVLIVLVMPISYWMLYRHTPKHIKQ